MANPVNWNDVSMLTPGMKNLGNQFNARWTERDGASDGAIGDYAHQQGDSDHNPDDTVHDNASWDSDSDNKQEVRAIDVDCTLNDPSLTSSTSKQAQMQVVIDHMRKLPNLSSVIRYMIFNKKMYHADDNFEPTTYTGSNSHSEHAHFSGARSQASDDNKTFDFKFDELGDDVGTVDKFSQTAYDQIVQAATQGVLTYGALGPDGKEEGGVAELPGATASNVLNLVNQTYLDLAALTTKVSEMVVPSPEAVAEAVVAALGGGDTDALVSTLKSVLTPEKLAALKAAL